SVGSSGRTRNEPGDRGTGAPVRSVTCHAWTGKGAILRHRPATAMGDDGRPTVASLVPVGGSAVFTPRGGSGVDRGAIEPRSQLLVRAGRPTTRVIKDVIKDLTPVSV